MVVNVLCKSSFVGFVRKCANRNFTFQIEQLRNRSLIKLTGKDVFTYLQGLITNDVNRLNEDKYALFSTFLNNKGRVLYDTLFYKHSENELLLECDSFTRDNLMKHLIMYRVRRKIDVELIRDHVWVIYSEDDCSNAEQSCNAASSSDNKYEIIESTLRKMNVHAFMDPRLYNLGVRIFIPESTNILKVLEENNIRAVASSNYMILRYKLGVAEGSTELLTGKIFPFEANFDYLNGINFHKGCYIGQELTARIHHTGVVRKRIMPLILSSVPDEELEQDTEVVTEDEKVVGKLRGIYKKYGIALLRIIDTFENVSKLKLHGIPVITYKPFWWPQKSDP